MTAAARSGSVLGGRTGLIVLLAVAWVCAFAVTALGSREAMVAVPALAVLLLASFFYTSLLRRSRVMPVDEIGTWYVGIVVAYIVLPVLTYLALGMEWTPFNDLRLFLNQPGPEVMAAIGWYFVAYLAAFGAAYLLVRGRTGIPVMVRPHVSRSVAMATFAVWVMASVGLLVPRLFYDLHASSYAESYTVLWKLPLLVRQAFRLAGGVQLIAQLVLLVWVFEDWKKRRVFVFGWLAFEVAQLVMTAGSRTEVMLVLVAATVLYHRVVRPVRFWVAASGSVFLLILFMGLGMWRNYQNVQDSGRLETVATAGEFEAVYATASDIYQRKAAGELAHLPPGITVG
ncbi:MAG TPA: hypothetical protein VFQ39_13735, partial [Longimicrobium sp.]|nr:hypothetical protein [Longimicrobium sp.]